MAYFFRDLKIAVRHLIRSPVFVTAALVMLALGIGAMTTIFSMVEGILLSMDGSAFCFSLSVMLFS